MPILTINHPDGEELIEQLQGGPVRVAFSNRTDTGWRPIPVVVAEIAGNRFPDEFVLFHGHLDSWHVGIGDNATGDATLLELARVFKQHAQHSTERCASPGGAVTRTGAMPVRPGTPTTFAHDHRAQLRRPRQLRFPRLSLGDRLRGSVVDERGRGVLPERDPRRDRPGVQGEGHVLRAGDCSFNNLGVTTYFMLSSTMPQDLVAEKGYYPVGGCGGNIAWHTEDDTIEIADRDNLLRDMRVYADDAGALAQRPSCPVRLPRHPR